MTSEAYFSFTQSVEAFEMEDEDSGQGLHCQLLLRRSIALAFFTRNFFRQFFNCSVVPKTLHDRQRIRRISAHSSI